MMAGIRKHRISANSIAGGLTAYTAIGSWVPPILRFLGLADMASGIDWYWLLYAHEKLNWPAIHVFVFFMAATALIAINTDLFLRWWRNRRARNEKIWDATARDAIFHIAHKSLFGEGKRDNESFESAVEAFNQALHSGELPLKGRVPGSAFTVGIPDKNRKSLALDPQTVRALDEGTGGKLLNTGKDSKIEYEGVLVDRHQLERLWPKSKKSNDGY